MNVDHSCEESIRNIVKAVLITRFFRAIKTQGDENTSGLRLFNAPKHVLWSELLRAVQDSLAIRIRRIAVYDVALPGAVNGFLILPVEEIGTLYAFVPLIYPAERRPPKCIGL